MVTSSPPSSAYIATAPCRRDDLRVDRGVRRGGHLDDRVDAVRRDLAHLGDDVLLPVVDDVVGAGGRGELGLRAGC